MNSCASKTQMFYSSLEVKRAESMAKEKSVKYENKYLQTFL